VTSCPTPTPLSLAVMLPSPTPLATIAPQALTPVPTNTPAPTPTPVVHIVEPGETLLGIALQYGVTLNDLQQVNGVLRPETLQIGQPLIIPIGGGSSPDAGGSTVLYPTPVPLPIVVENTARYQTPVGSVWVLGEVHNPGDAPLENVQVRVALLNDAGVEVANRLAFVALDAVPAGGRAPFGVLFEDPPANAAAFQAIVVRAEPSYSHDARYAQLQVIDPQAKQDGTTYHVTGSITNRSAANATAARIVVTVYDKEHHVTGYRQISIPDGQLPAGATIPFDAVVAPDPSSPTVADYAVIAQARAGQ
jgi:LysM repeat protein